MEENRTKVMKTNKQKNPANLIASHLYSKYYRCAGYLNA